MKLEKIKAENKKIHSVVFKKSFIKKAGTAVFWLLLWQLLYIAVSNDLLIASPLNTVNRIFELMREPDFWLVVSESFIRITTGFVLAVAAGGILAVLSGVSQTVCAIITPAMNIIKSTPVASFIILSLVWIKSAYLSVFISFLMVLPMVWSNILHGIRNIDTELLEMAKVYNFSFFKKLRLILFPSVFPYFLSACTTGLGFAWKSGIAAEILGLPKNSIGVQLNNAKIYLETTDLFAWTVVIIFLSIALEKLFLYLSYVLKRRVLRLGWKRD